MSKYLFRRKKQKAWPIALLCFCCSFFLLRWLWQPYSYMVPLVSTPLTLSIKESLQHMPFLFRQKDKALLEQLTLENNMLRMMLEESTDTVLWKNKKLQTLTLHNMLWQGQEHWFLTDPCSHCAIFNRYGLVGYSDAVYGEGVVKLITHRDTFLVARDPLTERTYLLQGQGYNRHMLILESDLTDYPPEPGHLLVTAGLDDLYPAGIAIGTVVAQAQDYTVQTHFNKKVNRALYAITDRP